MSTDIDREPELDLHIDLIFPHAPCDLLNYMVATGYTQKVDSEVEGLAKIRINGKTLKPLPDQLDNKKDEFTVTTN